MGEIFGGRYELVDPIGAGGSGAVWRCWDHRRLTYLAAKVLRQIDAADLVRFVREQSRRVAHPHVLAPTGWVGEDDRVLIAMDLVRGGSVHQLISDNGPLPLPWVAVLIDQLLDALRAVHGQRIIHRDVTPGNLLLEATGRERPVLRLADFGIATSLDEPRLTQTMSVRGTAGYVAPEAVLGLEPTAQQDLYAAGVVAYLMLTGQRPPTGVRWDELPRPAGLPDPVWRVLGQLTDEHSARRPASAADALAGWRAALDAAGVAPGWVRSNDPDAVEVFDHIGPLPDRWHADGPARDVARTPPYASVSPPAPAPAPATSTPVASPPPPQTSTPQISTPQTPRTPMPLAATPPAATPRTPVPGERSGGRVNTVVLVAFAITATILGIVLIAGGVLVLMP